MGRGQIYRKVPVSSECAVIRGWHWSQEPGERLSQRGQPSCPERRLQLGDAPAQGSGIGVGAMQSSRAVPHRVPQGTDRAGTRDKW